MVSFFRNQIQRHSWSLSTLQTSFDLSSRTICTTKSVLQSKFLYPAIRIGKDGSLDNVSITKADILSNCRIHMRDLLQLGLDVPHHHRHLNRLPPQLLPRGDCILGLIGPFKVIILHDHVLFFSHQRGTVQTAIDRLHKLIQIRYANQPTTTLDYTNNFTASSSNQQGCSEEISSLISKSNNFSNFDQVKPTESSSRDVSFDEYHTSTPFELVVVEHILVELCASYQRRMVLFQPVVSRLLFGLTHGSESDAMEGLHRLVPIKTGIGNFQMVIDEAVECLEHLLDNDEDLLGLLLTEKKSRFLITNFFYKLLIS